MPRHSLTDLLSAAFGLAALVAFGFTLWLAIHDALAAATLTGALFVVCAILIRLSDLETLEAFGGKARLVKQQLDRAEELVSTIRTASLVFAQHVYKNLAWEDRMFSQPRAEKRQMIIETDALLARLDVGPNKIMAMKHDILQIVAYDFIYLFDNIRVARMSKWLHSL